MIKCGVCRHVALSVLFCIALLTAGTSQATPPEWLHDYASDVERQANRLRIPGYAFVYYRQGEVPKVFVYGNTHKNGDPIDADTVFRLASVSKTFTALLTAKLIQQQQLSWDTPIGQLLPQFPVHPQLQTLSVADIVGQSSGLMPNAYDNLIEANYSVARVLQELAKLEPLCRPGDCYTYQNALFAALDSYLASQNMSYHRQMQVQVFAPLGMKNASVGRGGLLGSARWARPHAAIARDKWREARVESDYYRFAPAAGVNASIFDMTIYLQALLGEFPSVVPPSLVAEITQPRTRSTKEIYRNGWRGHLKDAHYGLGWRVYDYEGETLNYHGGWVKGYRAEVAFAPAHKVGFAMLMNAESNMINHVSALFWEQFFKQIKADTP